MKILKEILTAIAEIVTLAAVLFLIIFACAIAAAL